MTKLLTRAVSVAAEDRSWETLLLACRRRLISLANMIAAIDDGNLDVGARQGVAGFHGIVVRLDQLTPLIASTERPDPTEGGQLQSAAAFGHSVGLRDNCAFEALIEAGHVPAKARLHPGAKRMQYWIHEADISAFTARFATPSMLIAETRLHRNTIRKLLRSSRLAPFSPDGRDFGAIFLRSDLTEILQFSSAARNSGPKSGKNRCVPPTGKRLNTATNQYLREF